MTVAYVCSDTRTEIRTPLCKKSLEGVTGRVSDNGEPTGDAWVRRLERSNASEDHTNSSLVVAVPEVAPQQWPWPFDS